MRKRKAVRANNRGVFAILFVVAVLLVILAVQSVRLKKKNSDFELKKTELNQQIQDEEIRADEIKNMEEQVDSDEYIEKIARDKLGLVYEDEVVYRAGDE